MLRPQASQNHPVAHQLSGTTRHTAGKSPRQKQCSVFIPCLPGCVWILSCVFVLGFFFFARLFVCMFGGWWLPFFPLCEMAAKKPCVCRALLPSLWPAARPEVQAGAAAGLAHKTCSSGTRKARRGALGVGNEAGFCQAAKPSQGEREASVCPRDVL